MHVNNTFNKKCKQTHLFYKLIVFNNLPVLHYPDNSSLGESKALIYYVHQCILMWVLVYNTSANIVSGNTDIHSERKRFGSNSSSRL